MSDFESELKRHTLRPLPSFWRAQILAKARLATQPEPRPFWYEVLWGYPKIWAGFAAIWAVVLLLNLSSPESGLPMASQQSGPTVDELQGFEERQRMVAELLDGRPVRDEPINPFIPRRRSQLTPTSACV